MPTPEQQSSNRILFSIAYFSLCSLLYRSADESGQMASAIGPEDKGTHARGIWTPAPRKSPLYTDLPDSNQLPFGIAEASVPEDTPCRGLSAVRPKLRVTSLC